MNRELYKILLEEFSPPEDAFIEIESELRANAKRMGIVNFDNAFTIITNNKVNDIRNFENTQWIGYGTSWLDFIREKMPQWMSNYIYVLDIDISKVLNITNKNIKEFETNFILPNKLNEPKDKSIDFKKVKEKGYSGISFRPFNMQLSKNRWYHSVDVDSMVLVDKRAIRSVKLLLDASEILQDFSDR